MDWTQEEEEASKFVSCFIHTQLGWVWMRSLSLWLGALRSAGFNKTSVEVSSVCMDNILWMDLWWTTNVLFMQSYILSKAPFSTSLHDYWEHHSMYNRFTTCAERSWNRHLDKRTDSVSLGSFPSWPSDAPSDKKDDHKAFYVRRRLSGIMTMANVHSLAHKHTVSSVGQQCNKATHTDVIWVNQ